MSDEKVSQGVHHLREATVEEEKYSSEEDCSHNKTLSDKDLPHSRIVEFGKKIYYLITLFGLKEIREKCPRIYRYAIELKFITVEQEVKAQKEHDRKSEKFSDTLKSNCAAMIRKMRKRE